MNTTKIQLPFDEATIESLQAGQNILLTGKLITARDASHKLICSDLKNKLSIPFQIAGQTIYYVGPTPPKPGQIIGAAGPTTSSRMDAYTEILLSAGLKGMIGKGKRSDKIKSEMMKHKAIYLAAIGGAGAMLAKKIVGARVVAYPELGPEAVFELQVENFPVIVINDIYGGDLYIEGRNKF